MWLGPHPAARVGISGDSNDSSGRPGNDLIVTQSRNPISPEELEYEPVEPIV